MLRGIFPDARLTTRDRVLAEVYDRGLDRAQELRQQELEFLAQEYVNRYADAVNRGQKKG
jgi:hypothetical protein